MNIFDTKGSVRDLVDGKERYVWVLGYSISLGRTMELAIHQGTFPKYRGIICKWVTYFRGHLEGGPYKLRLIVETSDGETVHRLVSAADDFELRCSEMKVGKIRYDDP